MSYDITLTVKEGELEASGRYATAALNSKYKLFVNFDVTRAVDARTTIQGSFKTKTGHEIVFETDAQGKIKTTVTAGVNDFEPEPDSTVLTTWKGIEIEGTAGKSYLVFTLTPAAATDIETWMGIKVTPTIQPI